MNYEINNYIGDEKNRYILEKFGEKQLFIIGLNPSTADEKKLDATMRKILSFCENNDFDGFIMTNLYPQRTAKPSLLSDKIDEKIVSKNLEEIEKSLSKLKNPTVLCCWGNNVYERDYLKDCLSAILKICEKYGACYKAIKINKSSQPAHPLYNRVGEFIDFDIKEHTI